MKRRGFTLVELLVVIGVIAILIAMLLPALRKARFQAEVINCASSMRQALLALNMYAGTYRDFPGPSQDRLRGDWSTNAAQISNYSRAGGSGLAADYDGFTYTTVETESAARYKSWAHIMVDTGYAKSEQTLYDPSPMPAGLSDWWWRSNTQRDRDFGKGTQGAYHYYGPGVNSLTAYIFGWCSGYSNTAQSSAPCTFATLRKRTYTARWDGNWDWFDPLIGRSSPDQVLLSCPRFFQIIVDQYPTSGVFDPHGGPLPLYPAANGEQWWFDAGMNPKRACNRGYVDGHVEYFQHVNQR